LTRRKPHAHANDMNVWGVIQLEHQLHPEAFGRRWVDGVPSPAGPPTPLPGAQHAERLPRPARPQTQPTEHPAAPPSWPTRLPPIVTSGQCAAHDRRTSKSPQLVQGRPSTENAKVSGPLPSGPVPCGSRSWLSLWLSGDPGRLGNEIQAGQATLASTAPLPLPAIPARPRRGSGSVWSRTPLGAPASATRDRIGDGGVVRAVGHGLSRRS
jgi:hypothetical protein